MNRDHGFTLIEVIAVLFLLAVVTSVLLAGGLGGGTDENAAADVLKTHLRYAQSRSMNSDVSWGIRFDGASYTLIRDVGGIYETVRLPGMSGQNVDFPGEVTGIVSFDSWGRPSGLSAISLGGRTITITPDTGFIP